MSPNKEISQAVTWTYNFFLLAGVASGGPYGTRTRDLLRDRQASTPTGLTDQKIKDNVGEPILLQS